MPTVVTNSDEMDTRNSDEVHPDRVATLPESKPSHETCTTVSNMIHITHTFHACFFFNRAYSSLVLKSAFGMLLENNTSLVVNKLFFSCATVHGGQHASQKFDSGEYQIVLRKELTKSDVANVGRIVLPKVCSIA